MYSRVQTLSQQLKLGNGPNSEEQVSVFVNGVSMILNLLDPLYSIEEKFGMNQMLFILNNRVLSPASSLKFNGIKEGDFIYAIPKSKACQNQKNKYVQHNTNCFLNKLKERFEKKWSDKFSDPDSIFERLKFMNDPRTASESSRLSDLFKIRVENNPSSYRKVCKKYLLNDENGLGNKFPPTVIPNKLDSPSVEPLPDFSQF